MSRNTSNIQGGVFMKILFVRPRPSEETIGLQHLMIVEPLELEILYALKRANDESVIVDMILEKKTFEHFLHLHNPDVVCITGYITNVNTMIDYCKAAKRMSDKTVTVVGGVHCEVCPEDFIHEAIDYRVVRNATTVFSPLLNHIEKRTELPQGVLYKSTAFNMNELPSFNFQVPLPDRSACSKYRNKYFYIFQNKVALIKTSFGCPYSCNFCFCRIITAHTYYQRPLSEVIEELKRVQEKEVYIVDDDFLVDKKRIRDFLAALKQHKIQKHYLIYSRADFIATHPDIIHDFRKAGLRTVIIGFESFSDNELDSYNKNTNPAMYADTMKILKKEKIDCFATIIIPPHWDKNDFRLMVKMVKKLGIYFVNLQPLTPLPKTGINIKENDIILDKKSFEKWDLAHVSVRPSKLSVSDFYKEILHAYNAILYHPATLWKYLTTYKPIMLYKMLVGGYRVGKQYRIKIKEAQNA